MYPAVEIALPIWVESFVEARKEDVSCEVESRMQLAIDLSRENIRHGGGPFAACVFSMNDYSLIAPGVNLVMPIGCSVAHAEIVAIMIAQKVIGRFDLRGDDLPDYELVTSTEPCAQCYGAVPWSGIRHIICGAAKADAEAIGFDEGPKPLDWVQRYAKRGIGVEEGVLRSQAAAVLKEYAATNPDIYNGRTKE